MTNPELDTAMELDAAMHAAWPAAASERRGDWIMRYTSGVTRRANSVLALGEPDDVDAAIAAAERFYAHHDAPATFMVTEASTAPSTVAALVRHGYAASAETWILASTPDQILGSEVGRRAEQSRWTAVVSTEPSDSWFETYWSVDPTRGGSAADAAIVRDVLLRAPGAVFVEITDGTRTASVGQVVVGEEWACAQCLATAQWARRSGAGSQVMRQLAVEAQQRGAPGFFAAVMTNNAASLALCEGLSLQRSHKYSYYGSQ